MVDDSTTQLAHSIIEYAEKLINLPHPPDIPPPFAEDEVFLRYHEKVLTLRGIIASFAKGDLSPPIAARGFVAGSFKALQANLRHLTWQVQQIEMGDYTQRIDFLGEFSTAFNNMVVQLESTMEAVRQKEEALTHLAVSLQKEVEKRSAAVQALKKSEAKFKYLAQYDPLTGVFNRRSFFSLAQAELQNALARGNPCCVCLLDEALFKLFNDSYGHIEGDNALKHVVRHGTASLRQVDIMGRYGGEEFIFFFSGADLHQGCGAAERIRSSLENNAVVLADGTAVPISASLGVSVILGDWATEDIEDLLQQVIAQADAALYDAKAQGRNRVCAAPVVNPLHSNENGSLPESA